MAASREKVIQTAERFVARGKVDAAIREYRKVLQDHPRDTNTLNRVGDLYARIEKIPEAVSLFIRIAEHYTEDGFFVKAIAIYKKIIKLDPTRLEIYERLAELYHRQGLVNEARTQYQVLVDYYHNHGEVGTAIGICHRMLDLEPNNPTHRARLASLLEEQGSIAEAMAEYEAIAAQMIADGQLDGAARVYEKALDVNPDDLRFITDATLKLKDGGSEGAAARFLAAAVRRNPQAEQVSRLLTGVASTPMDHRGPDARVEEATAVSEGTATRPAPHEEPEEVTAFGATSGVIEGGVIGGELIGGAAAQMAVGEEEETDFGQMVADELDISLEEEAFVLDLEDEAPPPPTQVQPPPDMLEQAPRTSFSEPEPEPELAREPEPEMDVFAEEIELDLEFTGVELGAEEAGEEAAASELDLSEVLDEEIAAGEVHIDRDRLERVASELHPEQVEQEEDLVTEAEVLAKYGLRDKALERLDEVFRLNPRHLGAYGLQIALYLEEGRHERVVILANEMAAIANEMGQTYPWDQVRQRLLKANYRIEGDRRVLGGPDSTQAGSTEAAAPAAPPAGEAPPLPSPEAISQQLLPRSVLPEVELEFADPPTLPGLMDLGIASAEEMLIETVPEDVEITLEGDVAELEEIVEIGDLEEIAEIAPVEEIAEEEGILAEEGLFEVAIAEEEGDEPGAPPEAPPAAVTGPAARAAAPGAKRPLQDRDLDAVLDALQSSYTGRRPPAGRPGIPAGEPAPPPAAAPAISSTPAPAPVPPSTPLLPAIPSAEAMEAELEAALDGISLPGATGGPALAPPASGAVGSASPPPAPASLDDSGISWLDELAPPEVDPGGDGTGGETFSDEEGFFVDLASELEEELAAEERLQGNELFRDPREQSLEEIVEGFKRGVAEHLSPEDYETHFNLGIAYREMGLLDEAIGEFQLAAKRPERLVDCCSMLGLCFLDKGLPELAVKWYQKALQYPGLSEDESLGLLYELGNAYQVTGDRERAYKTFVEIYGINTGYRDVVARLEELAT